MSNTNVEYFIKLLSSNDGDEKLFCINETASHVAKTSEEEYNYEKIKSQTLDTLLKENKIPFPAFLKLDVQGHELEVLKGAQNALAHAEVCLLETTLLNIGDDDPLLADVIRFMDEHNFQAYDISQFMRRPYDKSLYQVDMFFVKQDSLLISAKRWK